MKEVYQELKDTAVSGLNLAQFGIAKLIQNPVILLGLGALWLLDGKKLKLGKFFDLKL